MESIRHDGTATGVDLTSLDPEFAAAFAAMEGIVRSSPLTVQQNVEFLLHSETLLARFAAISVERDEADRRAGAAERRLDHLEKAERNAQRWLEERKEELGYDTGVSFDTVWAETLAKARRLEALGAASAEAEEAG